MRNAEYVKHIEIFKTLNDGYKWILEIEFPRNDSDGTVSIMKWQKEGLAATMSQAIENMNEYIGTI